MTATARVPLKARTEVGKLDRPNYVFSITANTIKQEGDTCDYNGVWYIAEGSQITYGARQ